MNLLGNKVNLEEKRQRQREATKRWRQRNPEKVVAANRQKRVRVYDPEKRKAWRESRIERDPAYRIKVNTQAKERKDAINKFLREHKLKAGCADCGYADHHAALEFHHEEEKDVNLSMAKSLGMAKREMQKCAVLCANCHRVRHWNESHPCKPDIFEMTYEPVSLTEQFCDNHCTWLDHHPDCDKAEQPAQQEPLTGGDERRHIICLCPDCMKPAQQEPVAYLVTGPCEKRLFTDIGSATSYCKGLNKGWREAVYSVSPLYTTPQVREPLTDEQRSKMYRAAQMRGDSIMLRSDYEQGITDTEAAHGITKGNT